MKRFLNYSIQCAAVLAISLCTAFSAEGDASTKPKMGREEAILVTVTASVETINHETREVILKGPLGNIVGFRVDPQVKRLDEVKVGDFVRADYYVSFAAELRKPTAEEAKTPLVDLGVGGKAPAGTSPAAGGLRRFKVVTTVEGIDLSTKTITVKGPRGNSVTARVADSERLSQVKLGDNIIVTYTEALAISLEKAEKKGA